MNLRNNRLRLQQWQLAERQRYLDELEALAARLRGDARRLREEIDSADLRDMPGPGVPTTVYQLFLRPLIDRREKLDRSISTLDAQIVETRDAIVAAQQKIRTF